MIKIRIFSVGKAKDPWLIQALQEYQKRLKNTITIEWVLYKEENELDDALTSTKNYIALDPQGIMLSSEEFSNFLFNAAEALGSRIDIIIGGANGLSIRAKQNAKNLVSLSKMTFTHQATRLILLEQIYRAVKIHDGSSYHK